MENRSVSCPVSYVFWRITYANTTSIPRSNRNDTWHRNADCQHGHAREMVTSRVKTLDSRVFSFFALFSASIMKEKHYACLIRSRKNGCINL